MQIPMILIDSNVVIDLLEPAGQFHGWTKKTVKQHRDGGLFINAIVAAEIAVRMENAEQLPNCLSMFGFKWVDMSIAVSWRASRAHLAYLENKGSARAVLPDLIIGAHAVVEEARILTRDPRRFRTYFPEVELITPDTET